MKVYKEITASEFENDSWNCGYFWDRIHEKMLEEALDNYFEECYPDGIEETNLNDILRFDGDEILEAIGYNDEKK